jgi:hypothetical protein
MDYIPQEDDARKAKRALWIGSFTPPWDWRKGKRNDSASSLTEQDTSEAANPTSCKIKGNINRRGDRIYHLPSSRDYERTKLDEDAGERWFCSESDAIAAGWRAPRG